MEETTQAPAQQPKKSTSSKRVLAIVAVALLGALLGSGATYFVYRDDINDKNTQANNTQNTAIEPGTPVEVQQSLGDIPEGNITPEEVAKNFNNYQGKDVKIRGIVVETGENQYILASSQASGGLSIKLSAENIKNINEYVSAYTDTSKYPTSDNPESAPTFTKPVTVSGKVVLKDQSINIVAESITK